MAINKVVIASIEIEYIRVTRENLQQAAEWCSGQSGNSYIDFEDYNKAYSRVPIGWYLVKRPSGFQAMAPGEFEQNAIT